MFQGSEPDGSYPLKLYDPRQPNPITRLTERHVDNGGSLSPDERWLAYQSAAIGRSVVYVRPMHVSGTAIALSRDSGELPVFLHDGKTLALVRARQLVVRSWRDNNGRFEIGPERVVAPLPSDPVGHTAHRTTSPTAVGSWRSFGPKRRRPRAFASCSDGKAS